MLLSLSITAMLLLAQEGSKASSSGRQPRPRSTSSVWIIGNVVDRAGKGVPGAEILFGSAPSLRQPNPETRGTQKVLADARGRFRISVAWGRPILIGARWKLGNGGWGLTQVLRPEQTLQALYLREVREVQEPRLVEIQGFQSWRDTVDPSYRLRDAFDRCHPLTMDSNGRITLPVLPGKNDLVELVSKEGQILARRFASLVSGRSQIVLPPPLLVRVRVLDSRGNGPIRGAEIHRMGVDNQTITRPLAFTDTKGQASFWVSGPRQRFRGRQQELLFCVLANHREIGVFGWNSRIPEAKDPLPEGQRIYKPAVRTLRLATASFANGHLSGGSKEEWAGISISFRAHKQLGRTPYRRLPKVEARKTLRRYGIPFDIEEIEAHAVDLDIFSTATTLFSQRNRAWLDLYPDQYHLSLDNVESGGNLRELDLLDLRLLQIQVSRSSGEAAPFPRVYRLDRSDRPHQLQMDWMLDGQGHWLGPIWGKPPPLLFLHRNEYRILEHKSFVRGTRPGDALLLRVGLKPLAARAYRILDEDGIGVAGAALTFRPGSEPRVPHEKRLLTIQATLDPTRTDAEGRFVLTYIPEFARRVMAGSLKIKLAGRNGVRIWSVRMDAAQTKGDERIWVLDPALVREWPIPNLPPRARALTPLPRGGCVLPRK